MAIKNVGVVGCGLMGHGITQIAAQAGYDVTVRELSQEKLDSGLGRISKQLARAVEKGRMEQSQADEVTARIKPTLEYGDFADCDLVIEAITEDLGMKLEMWRELDRIVKEGALFATNTSSLGVIHQAAVTKRPDSFLGLHFFNPAQVMPLLEVVRTVTTNDATIETGVEFGRKLGKTTVHAKDKTGFVVNRLLVPLLHEAVLMVERGDATPRDVDTGMKLGCGHPMGPFELLDFVGLDTTQSVGEIMFTEFREKRFAPPPALRKLVTAGRLGRKTGSGFYDYSGDEPVPIDHEHPED
jgi:3-hydroxybutyryl-CoA dehydrogenase